MIIIIRRIICRTQISHFYLFAQRWWYSNEIYIYFWKCSWFRVPRSLWGRKYEAKIADKDSQLWDSCLPFAVCMHLYQFFISISYSEYFLLFHFSSGDLMTQPFHTYHIWNTIQWMRKMNMGTNVNTVHLFELSIKRMKIVEHMKISLQAINLRSTI